MLNAKLKNSLNTAGERLDDLGSCDTIFDTILKTPSVKAIVDELDFIKVKNLCSVKDNIKRIRREALG